MTTPTRLHAAPAPRQRLTGNPAEALSGPRPAGTHRRAEPLPRRAHAHRAAPAPLRLLAATAPSAPGLPRPSTAGPGEAGPESLVRIAAEWSHGLRVSRYARCLASGLGVGEKEAERISRAAVFHDVGKLALPRTILDKPGSLTPGEWEVVRTHPGIGAAVLAGEGVPDLDLARQIAFAHHENWDGSGYPRALRGEAIPLAARLVHLADRYDALRSLRPYKPAFGHERASAVLLKGDARSQPAHFDPRILDAFCRVHHQFAAIAADAGR